MPRTRRASARRSAPRTIILDGMHPQIGTLTPDQLGLDAHHVQSRLGELARYCFSTGSEADDDRIDLHRSYSPPQFLTW